MEYDSKNIKNLSNIICYGSEIYNGSIYIGEIKLNDDNKCIVCWDSEGQISLCVNCKLKYCESCAKKINNKCCICFRINDNPNQYYSINPDDFTFDFPSFYIFENFFTAVIFIGLLVLFFMGLSFFTYILFKNIKKYFFIAIFFLFIKT